MYLIERARAGKKRSLSAKFKKSFFYEIYRNFSLYTMTLPAVVLLLIFSYFPLIGLIIAFKDFKFDTGIWGSEWVKPFYNNFNFLFTSDSAFRAIRNTLFLNALFIFSGVIIEVGLALLINEITSSRYKKLVQSFTFLPYFVSWIVVGVFSYNFFSYDTGSVNNLLKIFGAEKIDWYAQVGLWPLLLLIFNRWKNSGYGAVVYLATLAGIDTSYYEAAQIDGASKWQQVRHISIPLLMPTVIILTLLQIGRIMNADFGMFWSLVGDASQLYPSTDVIDTFVYRNLRVLGDIGMASATGFVQSMISFVLVMGSNLLVRKYDKDSAIF